MQRPIRLVWEVGFACNRPISWVGGWIWLQSPGFPGLKIEDRVEFGGFTCRISIHEFTRSWLIFEQETWGHKRDEPGKEDREIKTRKGVLAVPEIALLIFPRLNPVKRIYLERSCLSTMLEWECYKTCIQIRCWRGINRPSWIWFEIERTKSSS